MGFGVIDLGRLLTLKEAADRLALSEESLRKKRVEGRLPVVRVGRSVRVLESFVDQAVRNGLEWPAHGTFPVKVDDVRSANMAAMNESRRLMEAEAKQTEQMEGVTSGT